MEGNRIWESVLQRLERGGVRLAGLCRDVRRAEGEEERSRAEKELAVSYALEVHAPGRDAELQILPEESDGLLSVVAGHDYTEQPRTDPRAELRARNEEAANIFEQEAQLWKTSRR